MACISDWLRPSGRWLLCVGRQYWTQTNYYPLIIYSTDTFSLVLASYILVGVTRSIDKYCLLTQRQRVIGVIQRIDEGLKPKEQRFPAKNPPSCFMATQQTAIKGDAQTMSLNSPTSCHCWKCVPWWRLGYNDPSCSAPLLAFSPWVYVPFNL